MNADLLIEELEMNVDSAFEGIDIIELDETMTLSETAASSGVSSCNSCSCCGSTSCCSIKTISIT
ncbi:thiazolylpeptide-type bacteriocin [Clostridium cellulovorans]|uniref:Thiazolylpeptide-type bacteriocin n=1 Tax=Clostridium cellulovorans (strain ATCC 35296 / DSM 3052 / OCM 3 / 743B) TaxID=573061 RepID=D9SWM8_CLOC7|nr:thiazolylpeptide-type bacteriocin [Clostridium cellulovorans]ADL53310.1 hypothetical protein Clocel_3639 [Clostridium cellulovorans 743B]